MSELNREQIIKALECCLHIGVCNPCYYHYAEVSDNDKCSKMLFRDALALINELTQANEQLSESYDHLEKTKDELLSERARLTEENELLGGEKEHLELVVEGKLKRTSALEKQVLSLTEENERLRAERDTLDIYNKDYKFKNKELTAFNRRWAKECAELQDECDQIKADTVRKMQDAVAVHFGTYTDKDTVKVSDVFRLLGKIANEMLEGGTDG